MCISLDSFSVQSAKEEGSTTIFSKEQKLSPVLHLSVMMKHKIQDDTKKGIKRKIDIASKVTKSKAPLKADLIVQHKELQEKLDVLEATNKKNLEIIKCLNEKIESMEKEKNSASKETQVYMGAELKCKECKS